MGGRAIPESQTSALCVFVELEGRPVRLIVDTGLQDVIVFEDRLLSRVPQFKMEDVTDGMHIGRFRGKLATLPGARLGSRQRDLKDLLVKGPPGNVLPGVNGYLGIESLNAQRVEFNFADHTLRWD